jgi:hypothetical protein
MPKLERAKHRSSKIFAPIILSGLLIAGVIRCATEDSGKTTRSSSPTQTSILRDQDNSAATAAMEAGRDQNNLAATAASETVRGPDNSAATAAMEAAVDENNSAATAAKEATREPHATTKHPAGLIRRGSSFIEASMGFPPRDPNKFVGKIVWASPVTACFRYQEHYVCTALSPSLKGRVLIIGEDLIGDPGLKERIDSRCDSLSRMCHADVVFRFDSWELDMSGETMFIRTDLIHASKPR